MTATRAHAAARAPQAAHHLEPVEAGQHQVEHDEVGPALAGQRERRGPSRGDARLVAGALEVAGDDLGDRRLVVDDQHRPAPVAVCVPPSDCGGLRGGRPRPRPSRSPTRWAGKHRKGAEAAGIEIGNPGAVAITPSSLVTMKVKVSAMGAIKEVTEVLSIVPLAEVDSLEVKRMGLTGVMEISAGGGSFKLEGEPGDMKELAEVFERTKAGA